MEIAAAPVSPVSPLKRALQLLYALLAGSLSVWLASFVPSDGGAPIGAFLPSDTIAALRVRSGTEIFSAIESHRILGEIRADPDVRATLFQLTEKDPQARSAVEMFLDPRKALEFWKKAPSIVRQFVPPTAAGAYPFAGRECGVAFLAPRNGNRNPLLIFTRLSGVNGALARLGIYFAPKFKSAEVFDLGNGLVAVGFNGAQVSPAHEPATGPLERPTMSDAMLSFFPKNLPPHPAAPILNADMIAQLREDDVPNEVVKALETPPSIAEMLNLHLLPERIDIAISANAETISAQGKWTGATPAFDPPAIQEKDGSDAVILSAVLPIDARECVMRYFCVVMHNTRERRRWTEGFAAMAEQKIDMERSLWPAAGHTLYLRIEKAQKESTETGFGLVSGAINLDGSNAEARRAVAEIGRIPSDYLFDGPPTDKPPYVRRFRNRDLERYFLVSSQFVMPSWTVSSRDLRFVSDVGPFVLIDEKAAIPQPETPADPKDMPRDFHIHANSGVAETIEWAVSDYLKELERVIGPKAFLARYPDAEATVRLSKKLGGLLGALKITMKPAGDKNSADLSMTWKLGTMKAATQPGEDDAAPPPPRSKK